MTEGARRAGAGAARPQPGLREALEGLYRDFDRAGSAPDPIDLVRTFDAPADREIVGFCAAGLALGRVASIKASIGRLIDLMRPSPAAFVSSFSPDTHGGPVARLAHRWITGRDLVALLWVLRQMIDRSGSVEAFFLEGYDPAAPDVGDALESFSVRAMALDLTAAYGRVPPRPGVGSFFPRPRSGSACKRLNLYLRWMVRRDHVDLGAWSGVSPSKLVVPLDVHVVRLGRCLGLTRYSTPGWKMAAEITAALRELDPVDPVRFDFALCHLGMRQACGVSRPCGETDCPLRPFCRAGARTPRRSRPPSGRR